LIVQQINPPNFNVIGPVFDLRQIKRPDCSGRC
jgi:hypothetical protein